MPSFESGIIFCCTFFLFCLFPSLLLKRMGRKPTLTRVMREKKTHAELEPALRLVSK